VFDPTYVDADGEMTGRYIEAHSNDFMTVSVADFKVDIDASQTNYMEQVLTRFSKEHRQNPDQYPETVIIYFKFITRDPTNKDESKG
jgi:hypothetical protein